jgi:hypothetical protein
MKECKDKWILLATELVRFVVQSNLTGLKKEAVQGRMTPKWYLKVPGHQGHIKGSL